MSTRHSADFTPVSQKHYSPPTISIQVLNVSDIIVTSPEVGGEWPWQEELINFG